MPAPDPRIAFFDQLAPHWDAEHAYAADAVARLEELRPKLGLQAGQHLLEVGCGTGQLTGWLVEQVRPGRVTAVDFAPAMIAHAQRRHLDAELHCVDVCRDDLGVARYDVVWCKHSFPHFRDQAGALRNLTRALKPGGHLIVLHTIGWQALNAMHGRMDGPVAADFLPAPAQWSTLLNDAGLQLVELIERDDLFFLRAARPAT